jgi:hypothetical protein
MTSATQSEQVISEPPPSTGGVFDELGKAIGSAREMLSNFLNLASLEAHRAVIALVWMMVGGVAAAICVAAAWLGLVAALVLWTISLGLPPIAAIVMAAGINLIFGIGLIYVSIGISRNLLFVATRRQVAGGSEVRTASP